jgi:hypothetical protein
MISTTCEHNLSSIIPHFVSLSPHFSRPTVATVADASPTEKPWVSAEKRGQAHPRALECHQTDGDAPDFIHMLVADGEVVRGVGRSWGVWLGPGDRGPWGKGVGA